MGQAFQKNLQDGYELSDEVLYKSHVFITPGGIFGSAGDKYIRVSLCGSVEKFEEAIKRITEIELNHVTNGKKKNSYCRECGIDRRLILAIQLHEKKLSSKLIGVDANADHAQEGSRT